MRALDLSAAPPDESLDRLTRLAARLLGAPVALIAVVEDEHQFLRSQVGVPEPWTSRGGTPMSHSFCRYVVATGEPFAVQNAHEHPLAHDGLAVDDLGVVAYAGAPLRLAGGHSLGALCVAVPEPRDWTRDELDLLSDLADTAISQIELRAAIEEARRARDVPQAEPAAASEGAGWHRHMLQAALVPFAAVDEAGLITDWNDAACRTFGWTGEEAIGRPLDALVVAERYRKAYRRALAQLAEHDGTTAIDRQMELFGLHRDGYELPVEVSMSALELGGRRGFLAVLRDLSERKRREAELRYLADHDPLTGLYNRRRFDEELRRFTARAAREGEGGALVMLDLDGLKELNDGLGHPAGDHALQHAAQVISGRARATDLAARLGGDEFAMLLDGAGLNEAVAVGESICRALRDSDLELTGRRLRLTASAGAMVIRAQDGDLDGVLRRADTALYEAKRAGGDRVVAAS